MKVSQKRAEEFAIKINEDMGIDDAAFEAKYQHIRDDILYYGSKGDVNLDIVADFHGHVVFSLYEKYFGGENDGSL